MSRVLMLLWILLCVVVVVLGYIRLAPSDPADWHKPLEFSENKDFKSGVQRAIPGDAGIMAALDGIARATPRTTVLAGSVEAGMVTYLTRSQVFGFPDYTTVQLKDGKILIYARQRFGRQDLGVNKARVDGWLSALQAR